MVLRLEPGVVAAPRALGDLLTPPDEAVTTRHVAALRVGREVAVAALEAGSRVDGLIGAGAAGQAEVVAVDPIRDVARLRVPAVDARPVAELALASLQTPLYVVAVEGTQAGITLRPVFLGRGGGFQSARWTRPLLPLGGMVVSPGALLFSFAGQFLGTVVQENGAAAIASARDVLDTVGALAADSRRDPVDIGIVVQPLTPPLAASLGAARGIVVASVDATGAAAGALQPADVITAVDDWSTDDPNEFLLRLASRPGSTPVTISLLRNRSAHTVVLPAAAQPASVPRSGGWTFTAERGGGTRVGARSRTADGAGSELRRGDVITRAGAVAKPTPAQMTRLLATPATGGFLPLLVLRDGRQRVVAVAVPHRDDAVTP